jgi:hypothetical protein
VFNKNGFLPCAVAGASTPQTFWRTFHKNTAFVDCCI